LQVGTGEVLGVVIGPHSESVARARVELRSATQTSSVADAIVLTALDGSFQIAGLEDGAFVLVIASPGLGTWTSPVLRAPADVGRVLLHEEAKIALSVVDDRQQPILGATAVLSENLVAALPRSVLTSAEGRCSFNALAAGRFSLSVSESSHESATVSMELRPGEDRPLEIVLVRLGAISLRAFGPNGSPVIRALITLRDAGGHVLDGRDLSTDDEGKLVIPNLASGNYTLSCPALELESPVAVRPGAVAEVVLGGNNDGPREKR